MKLFRSKLWLPGRARIGISPDNFLQFITLEETHELFDRVGFKDSRIHARHHIDFIDHSFFLHTRDASSSIWQIGLTSEEVEEFKKKFVEEAAKLSTEKGFKLTWVHISAHGVKPK